MLSTAATKLLPDLSSEEIFEINKIYSAKGLLGENEVIVSRPYREVNKQTSEAALFGGPIVIEGRRHLVFLGYQI